MIRRRPEVTLNLKILSVESYFQKIVQSIERSVYTPLIVLSSVTNRYTFLVLSHEIGIDLCHRCSSGHAHGMSVRKRSLIQKFSIPVGVISIIRSSVIFQKALPAENPRTGSHRFGRDFSSVAHPESSFFGFLCGHKDDASGRSGTIYGTCRRILKNVYRFYLVLIERAEMSSRNSVNHNKRCVIGIDRRHTAQLESI